MAETDEPRNSAPEQELVPSSEPEPEEEGGTHHLSVATQSDVSTLSILDVFDLRYTKSSGSPLKLRRFTSASWAGRNVPPCRPYNLGKPDFCPYFHDPKGCLYYRTYIRAQSERGFIAHMVCGKFVDAVMREINYIEEEHPGLSVYERMNLATQLVALGEPCSQSLLVRNIQTRQLLLAKLPTKNGHSGRRNRDRRRVGERDLSDNGRIERLLGADALAEVIDGDHVSSDILPEYAGEGPDSSQEADET